jgi:hypothetical protein
VTGRQRVLVLAWTIMQADDAEQLGFWREAGRLRREINRELKALRGAA